MIASVDQLRSTATLVFDLRTALRLDEGNTAVLYVEGVTLFEWRLEGHSPEQNALPYMAWNVVGQTVAREGSYFTLGASFVPDAHLHVCFARVTFHVVNIPGLPAAPPDFTDSDPASIGRGMPGWDSPIDDRFWTVSSDASG